MPQRAGAALLGLDRLAALPAVPLAHPLWVADDLRIVSGNRELAGKVMSRLRILDPAPGPLAVVGDQDDGRRCHRRGRFDEGFHTAPGAGELLQVRGV